MSKEKKIMIRIAYEDETGKKDMRDILAKDYQDALSQLRGEICSGSKIEISFYATGI